MIFMGGWFCRWFHHGTDHRVQGSGCTYVVGTQPYVDKVLEERAFPGFDKNLLCRKVQPQLIVELCFCWEGVGGAEGVSWGEGAWW